jgi:hypothetical protein
MPGSRSPKLLTGSHGLSLSSPNRNLESAEWISSNSSSCRVQAANTSSRDEPRNRTVSDIVGAGNFPHRLAPVPPLDSFRLLVRGQFWFPPRPRR